MKFEGPNVDLDAIDLAILDLLQDNCKQSLATIGEKVGLKAPSVVERIHKLEDAGVIRAYTALLDARMVGRDVTAFIGVSIARPAQVAAFERELLPYDEVQECHHVTGSHTLMLKVKTASTSTLEDLIDRIRALEGITETETMVVLSTKTERPRVSLSLEGEPEAERAQRGGPARGRRGPRREARNGRRVDARDA